MNERILCRVSRPFSLSPLKFKFSFRSILTLSGRSSTISKSHPLTRLKSNCWNAVKLWQVSVVRFKQLQYGWRQSVWADTLSNPMFRVINSNNIWNMMVCCIEICLYTQKLNDESKFFVLGCNLQIKKKFSKTMKQKLQV